jgi:hypothetical protein
MLVYGDAQRIERVGDKRAAIRSALADIAVTPPGLARHAALVRGFIEVGELLQGIADAEFEERGFDGCSPAQTAAMDLLLAFAQAIDRSWRSRFADGLPVAGEGLDAIDQRRSIRIRQAEGYAFYALYPESYLEAARRSGLNRRTGVIGIRSIGAGLAALVAAVLDAPPPITLRPVGHPFRREVKVDPALAAQVVADADRPFAIVDEGPGLSGSSFGAVADWLENNGVSPDRIHFFPSHQGDPGPQASPTHRERWAQAARHSISMDDLLLDAPDPCHRLGSWLEALLGPLDGPLEDISAGVWRAKAYPGEHAWPAADIRQERRKFLARACGSAWLARFAGLGAAGLGKLGDARLLSEAGFTPEPAGYRHGFLVERWVDGGTSLDQVAVDRGQLVERIGAYLGFRACRLPASTDRGASLGDLLRMACHNTEQVLGPGMGAVLERQLSHGHGLDGQVRRVRTDNRMQAHEWIVTADRQIIKADALDHSAAHDLVGCQDIAWDVIGAAVEFDLSRDESARLCEVVGQEAGRGVDPALLAFLRPCYLAFHMGAHAMAADAIGGAEAPRLRAACRRYAARLSALLACPAMNASD